jgi:cold shock CspA family protein
MLVGHKAELGIKHITKVTIVTQDPLPSRIEPKFKEMDVFFHIEDVPPDEVEDEKPGEEKPGDNGQGRAMGLGGETMARSLHVRSEGGDVVRVHTFSF